MRDEHETQEEVLEEGQEPEEAGSTRRTYLRSAGLLGLLLGVGATTGVAAAKATGMEAFVGGGRNNDATASFTAITGGRGNDARAPYAYVGGGRNNDALADYATISGGTNNTADGDGATIGGGEENVASNIFSTIGGGLDNNASGRLATIGGGAQNTASGLRFATVGGGQVNVASGDRATVSGGLNNTASGKLATVPGGYKNEAGGDLSLAVGQNAQATDDGAYVWADGTGFEADEESYTLGPAFASNGEDSWSARTTGGARFVSAVDDSGDPEAGVELAPGSGSWSSLSASAAKANTAPVEPEAVLDKVTSMDISTWNYTAQDDEVRHMGPMAEEFAAAFGLGESEHRISTVDADGVALAAVQGLAEKLQERSETVERLREENADLEARLEALEEKVTHIE